MTFHRCSLQSADAATRTDAGVAATAFAFTIVFTVVSTVAAEVLELAQGAVVVVDAVVVQEDTSMALILIMKRRDQRSAAGSMLGNAQTVRAAVSYISVIRG